MTVALAVPVLRQALAASVEQDMLRLVAVLAERALSEQLRALAASGSTELR